MHLVNAPETYLRRPWHEALGVARSETGGAVQGRGTGQAVVAFEEEVEAQEWDSQSAAEIANTVLRGCRGCTLHSEDSSSWALYVAQKVGEGTAIPARLVEYLYKIGGYLHYLQAIKSIQITTEIGLDRKCPKPPSYSGNRLHTKQKAVSEVNRHRVRARLDSENERGITSKVVVES